MNLNDDHWHSSIYVQRMTIEDWERLLRNGQDRIIFRGRMYLLEASVVGEGIVEVRKDGCSEEIVTNTVTDNTPTKHFKH
jgi:hypothetical protein